MILQELAKLYTRLADDKSVEISNFGFSPKDISFAIIINHSGYDLIDLRTKDNPKGRLKPISMDTPSTGRRTSGIKPGFLCDKTSYIFGIDNDCEESDTPRLEAERKAFLEIHKEAEQEINSREFTAVCNFLSNPPKDIKNHPLWPDFSGKNGVFKIAGSEGYIHQLPLVKKYWDNHSQQALAGRQKLPCLISNQISSIAEVHPAIKGIFDPGGQAEKGMVNFNKRSFESLGHNQAQGLNAPTSELAAFRYVTALNYLLKNPKHRLRIGDTTIVFWTESPSSTEDVFADIFDEKSSKDAAAQDITRLQKIAAFWQLVRTGTPADWEKFGDTPGTRFHILGLSPNAARLSVRFWHTGTLGEFATRLKEHADAMALVRSFESDREHPPLWLLLAQTARDSDGIPPLLGGALLRSVLTGGPYPTAMAQLVINRIRADHKIDHLRAAFLKAYLTRLPNPAYPIPLPMSLDTSRTEPAYLLGRLFATYEKNQGDASGGTLNATIRDRYYSAASATPRAVFGTLARTGNHHLAKLHPGQRVQREKLMQEICDKLADYPAHLNLAGQALFTLGYYHQTAAFYAKKDTAETTTAA